MRERFSRFMEGRYGQDDLSKVMVTVTLVLVIVNLFLKSSILGTLAFILLICIYFRMFSKNIYARSSENQKFLNFTAGIRSKFSRQARRAEDLKTHHIYKCPGCKQKIRVPRGKGKICITCPKCGREFTKKS